MSCPCSRSQLLQLGCPLCLEEVCWYCHMHPFSFILALRGRCQASICDVQGQRATNGPADNLQLGCRGKACRSEAVGRGTVDMCNYQQQLGLVSKSL